MNPQATIAPAQVDSVSEWDWENSLRRRAISGENLRAGNESGYARNSTAPAQQNRRATAAAQNWERRRAMGREAEKAASADRNYVLRRAL